MFFGVRHGTDGIMNEIRVTMSESEHGLKEGT
jgi:hypothetical protein